jgi:hypothetical protein
MKIYWGPAGENPVIDAEYYTEGEWLLETIKNAYTIQRPPYQRQQNRVEQEGSKK